MVILSSLISSSASRLQVVENHRLSLSAPLRQSGEELHTHTHTQIWINMPTKLTLFLVFLIELSPAVVTQ